MGALPTRRGNERENDAVFVILRIEKKKIRFQRQQLYSFHFSEFSLVVVKLQIQRKKITSVRTRTHSSLL